MCLSIPGRVIETFKDGDLLMGKVGFGGIVKTVCMEHVPDAAPGEYVLVHVGFALARIDEDEACRIFEFLESIEQVEELTAPS